MRLLFALLLLVAMASAQMNVSLSDQGTGVRYYITDSDSHSGHSALQ